MIEVVVGFVAGLVIAVLTTPVGVSGAVFLLPVQLSVLAVPNPAVTPTNLLFNVVSGPGALLRYGRRGALAGPLTRLLLWGTLPGVVAGALIRVYAVPGPRAFRLIVAAFLLPLGVWLCLRTVRPGRAPAGPPPAPRTVTLLSLAVGVVGGIYGIGGGSILGPILVGRGMPVAVVGPAALASTFVTSIVGADRRGALRHPRRVERPAARSAEPLPARLAEPLSGPLGGTADGPLGGTAVGALRRIAGVQTRAGNPRPITRYGNPVLHRRCAEVTVFDDDLERLIADMFASMAAADGVGLAANQIGVDARIFVVDCPDATGTRIVAHVVNPVLHLPEDRGLDVDNEGCLSVPGVRADVGRPATSYVTGVDMHNNPVRIDGTGLLARCLQHETDHLDGMLYVDRLPAKQRKKLLKESAEAPPVGVTE
ncbi:peptide deformylase [Pseudosporangium ferrugineum]|uniref:Peptide deformylase n=1 Tax=Pseudosporangium ferrugineum TaxID=439699 RepID=A0A2T0REB2_9ACTN|nr:peptide deformylase [Pseudosporangium ferrugineum]